MFHKTLGIVLAIGISCLMPVPAHAGVIKQVPVHSQFKTFMDYRTITDKHSPQWQLQTQAITDANGLRVKDGRYLIAVGSYFTNEIGKELNVYLSDGTVLPCIVGDAKANRDTINGHSTGTHNDAIEFIVDQPRLHRPAKQHGDCSYIPGMNGAVTSIEIGVDGTPLLNPEVVSETLSTLEEVPEEVSDVVSEDTEVVVMPITTEEPIVMNVLEEASDVQL